MDKVSIIVPVYNVEKYIDQCIESICGQTYKDLEIILVYDESSDNSLQKCREWAEIDSRIILLISEDRRGLGAARNLGLKAATGVYVVYLDSDDWMDEGYVEVLYRAIKQTQADYVSSTGYYEVRQETQINKRILLPAGEYSGDMGKLLILLGETPAVWKKIYNRKWLVEHDLFQPELFHYEDWGFDIALVLQTEKIVLIPQIGVYYRFRREGSLSNERMEPLYLDFRRSIEFGLNKAEDAGALTKYHLPILKYLLQDYCMRKWNAYNVQNDKALQILKGIEKDIIAGRLGFCAQNGNGRHLCFGSMSLYWIMGRTAIFAENMEYYGFSSLISALSKSSSVMVRNQNEFRANQVSKDIEGAFGKTIESINEKTVLFIDFLEERNPVLEMEAGGYITQSEAYADSVIEGMSVEKTICCCTDQFAALWKAACLSLVEKLKQKREMVDIVLVKDRLALRHGDLTGTKVYMGGEDLKRINDMISDLEDYFLEQCGNNGISAAVFDLPEEYGFTDEQFKYGIEPQYMNGALYNYVGFEIFRQQTGQMRTDR